MSANPESPQQTNLFDKRAALTIAIVAIFLAFIQNQGSKAKTEALTHTNQMSNTLTNFQSNNIRTEIMATRASLLTQSGTPNSEADLLREEIKKYEGEKKMLSAKAEESEKKAETFTTIEERCHVSSLILQIAVVLSAIAILAHWTPLWIVGSLIGASGVVVGVSSFFMT